MIGEQKTMVDLGGAEPDGSEAGGDPEDEDLRRPRDELPHERHPETACKRHRCSSHQLNPHTH